MKQLGAATLAALAGASASANTSDAKQSDSASQRVALARAYEHGEGTRKDLPKAAALYCEAARDGDAEAQFSLGWMYTIGRGVERDDALAGAFFDLAAAGGHAHAQRSLALVGPARAALPACMTPPPPPVVAEALAPAPELPVETTPDPFAALPPAKQKIARLVGILAGSYAVEPRLALSVIAVESNFEPLARSEKDAHGLMQLIPKTARRFNVRNIYDVNDNLRGGLAYLRWLLAYYQGQVPLALAAYNAGENAVDRYRGIPPYAETQMYVRRVLRLFGRERHAFDASVVAPSPILVRERNFN